jgi:hypothetical protein
MVWWTAEPVADGYRIYRAPVGTTDLALVMTAGPQNLSPHLHCWELPYTDVTNHVIETCRQYHDAAVQPGTYAYYVASFSSDPVSGVPYESTLALARPLIDGEGGEEEAEELVYEYDFDVTAGPVYVIDGREEFETVNAASRRVELRWPKVSEPGLQGYHVYRQCAWDQCSVDVPDAAGVNDYNLNLETLNCVNSWVRLTSYPISTNFFTDETVGGLGGCFNYMVRPIGPEPRREFRRAN